MTGEPTHTTSKKEEEMVLHAPAIKNCLKSEVLIMLHCQLCMFNPVYSITNQKLFEKYLCNQRSHYEKYCNLLFSRFKNNFHM